MTICFFFYFDSVMVKITIKWTQDGLNCEPLIYGNFLSSAVLAMSRMLCVLQLHLKLHIQGNDTWLLHSIQVKIGDKNMNQINNCRSSVDMYMFWKITTLGIFTPKQNMDTKIT